jgi:hypothetical protein
MVTDQETVQKFGMDNGVIGIESDSDKKTKSLVKSHVQFHDFVYCSFDNYLSHLNEETTEEKVQVCLIIKLNHKPSCICMPKNFTRSAMTSSLLIICSSI